LKNMFQRGDRARSSAVGQTAVKRQLRGPKWSCHLTSRPVLTSDTIRPIGGVELRKPDTDAGIITRGTLVRVALEAAQLLKCEGLQVGVLDLRWLAPLE
jgi:pyruvate/2-oxoglutarate/acetoin dehydrogenase E1 component